jgi:CubicO group peptidase (beta-lactamase class C family)
MKNIFFTCLLLFSISVLSAQKRYPVSYTQLKEYEGVFEYFNNAQIKIAASPVDTILYGIINQSRYALRPTDKDVFTNNLGQSTQFLRNSGNSITGYVTGKDTFKLITKMISFPEKMWYPRSPADLVNYHYHYTIPPMLNDGLPTGDAAHAGLDTALLTAMMNKIVMAKYLNVHSILIIKGGKLVFEEYFYDYGRDSLQEQRSATKSAVSALTGIAIHKGYIKSVNEKVLLYFPEYHFDNNSELKQRITVQDLLSNQSGLNYDEAYDKAVGNENTMSYTDDWIKYTLDLPMLDTPGTKGRYASGNPITMARIIEKTTNMPLHDFAVKNLYGPMGITNFKWNFTPDKRGAENYGEVFLRPRDMAKFGLLYLNNGVWDGKQIVPAEWVKKSTSKHSVVQGVDYGYLWWLKYLDADGGVRYNSFAAQGNGGQKIFVFKQQQLVVVVTGGNYNTQSPSNELVRKYILPAFNKN